MIQDMAAMDQIKQFNQKRLINILISKENRKIMFSNYTTRKWILRIKNITHWTIIHWNNKKFMIRTIIHNYKIMKRMMRIINKMITKSKIKIQTIIKTTIEVRLLKLWNLKIKMKKICLMKDFLKYKWRITSNKTAIINIFTSFNQKANCYTL